MPKWTPELDAILLHGVFEECNISFSKNLCAKIAQRVRDTGIECTAKAVENRLYSWKKKNISGNTNLNAATNTPVKEPKTPKTPRFSNKKVTPLKRQQSDGESDGPEGLVDDKNELLLSPTPARRKRKAVKTYAESQSEDNDTEDIYVPKSKMKTEQTEDEFTIAELEDEVI